MRVIGRTVLLLAAFLAALASAVAAQSTSQLHDFFGREFDARGYGADDKRFLQLGLTVEGDYVGLLDGRWGAGSQHAFEAFAARIDEESRADGVVRNSHVFAIASRALVFANDHELAFRGGRGWLHRFLSPPGEFRPDPDTAVDDLELVSGGVTIRVMTSDGYIARALHDRVAERFSPNSNPYFVRRADRLVTAERLGAAKVYMRSDRAPDGFSWFTTLVSLSPGWDDALLDVIVASITLDPTADLLAPKGPLDELIDLGLLLLEAPEVSENSPQVARADLPGSAPRPQVSSGLAPATGSGTGFFVNNTDVITARHVIEDCDAIALAHGTPLGLVAIHPTLDLALLSSPQRSRDWIGVRQSGPVRLGQRVVALGYPFFGAMSTALNSTGGNVSALVGPGDDRRKITVTAPIHPGNSGGPLLGSDGLVVGVVVATIDKIAVAEATGVLPENTNYAVTGVELLSFLRTNGATLPADDGEPADLDDGIPERMQAAVVPVICHGGVDR